MSLPNIAENRISSKVAPGEWAKGCQKEVFFLAKVTEFVLAEVDVMFDLVAKDGEEGECFFKQRGRKITDSAVPDEPAFTTRRHRLKRFFEWDVCVRPMDEKEIKVIGVRSLEALLGRSNERIPIQVVVPDFGREEDIFPIQGMVLDGASDLAFVLINPRRIEVPVADLQSIADGVVAGVASEEPGAKTQGGDGSSLDVANDHP